VTETVPTPEFVAAMGQHVSSVCVITTRHEGQRYGLTATAMTSVCADPPRLLVCVNNSGVSHDMIKASGVFCVNVLAEQQLQTAKAFAGMMGKDFDKFSVGEWYELQTGAPALVKAVAVFDCRIAETIDQFSHAVFIGEVLAVSFATGQDALLYGARRFRDLRKIGMATDGVAESLHF
jgi:flavin reductase (DIM6/NTAB) family NADH-FMN oxidoreductase RutF